MRLHRPYIPVAVRLAVAERQFAALAPRVAAPLPEKPAGARLRAILEALFGNRKPELHHRPALLNRRQYVRAGETRYDPPANDPDHLVWLAKDDHDIETRVRGVGAQLSDLAQARKRKRRERKLNVGDTVRLKNRRGKTVKTYKIAWVSRPMQSANRWPKGRKIQGRKR